MQPTQELTLLTAMPESGERRRLHVWAYEDSTIMVGIVSPLVSLKVPLSDKQSRELRDHLNSLDLGTDPIPTQVTVQVDLFKPSGKWAYGFKSTFDVPSPYVENAALLDLISKNQSEVSPTAVTGGSYDVYIKETEECMNDPKYQGFLCRMIKHWED